MPVSEGRQEQIRAGAFTLPLPIGWADRTVVTLVGTAADGFASNIVVTHELLCDNMGPGGFSVGWLNKLAEEVPVVEVRPVEQVEVDGRRAHLRVVTWGASGLRLTQIAALFVDGDVGYAIVGTATEWTFDALEPRFRDVLRGFRLTPS